MQTLYKFSFALFLVIGLASCEATGNGSRNEAAINRALDRLEVQRGNVVNSVSNFRINGWQAVNDRNLIVTAGLHDHYLVTLSIPCQDLTYAFNIGIDSRTTALSRGDYIVVNSLHRQLERCPILEITQLVDRDPAGE